MSNHWVTYDATGKIHSLHMCDDYTFSQTMPHRQKREDGLKVLLIDPPPMDRRAFHAQHHVDLSGHTPTLKRHSHEAPPPTYQVAGPWLRRT